MGSLLNKNSSAVRKRIESHDFQNEEGEEYEASKFGGFADYMRRKKIKLQNLDAEIRSSSAETNPPIFRGVVAHVNGYTQPSLQDLHRLIVSHGGCFLQYLDGKTAATHIIASSLTPKKKEDFRRYRMVKPAWVVESIKAGRLLPWDAYRVVDEGQSQKVLHFNDGRILSRANTQPSGYKDQSSTSWYNSQFQNVLQAEATPTSKRETAMTPKAVEGSHSLQNEGTQSDYGEFPSFSAVEEPAMSSAHQVQPEQRDDTTTDMAATTPETAPTNEAGYSSDLLRATSPQMHQSPSTKRELTSEEYNAHLLSNPLMRKSSVVNPEFLQQFYRESRLHHLSTWKAELKAQLQSAAKDKSQSQRTRGKPLPGQRRYILHVDFDCFFAAVSIRKHPELEGKPVAIAHGTGSGSEIASCNYPARAFGIKNGMWMKGALQMCPDLKVLPYDFPAYEDASRKFYSAVLAIDGVVQSVSIDEALVDVTTQCLKAGGSDGRGISEGSLYREQAKADEIAANLRAAVKEKTGCDVSVGIGGNILLAKVALRKAKPAGQFQLKPDAVLDFIGNLAVQDLPGVGYSLGAKLEELGVKLVKDIRDISRERLTSHLGPKTGAKMWDYARGIDKTEVGAEVIRKSVSAEVNWGIRFTDQNQAEEFVRSLCEELHRRLVENLVKGKQLTLKVMRRAADAPLEPAKHLGHGQCDVFNKSVVLGVATNASDVLGREAVSMLKSYGFSPGDLRGLGVQMTKLESLKAGPAASSQKQLTFEKSPVRRSVEQHADPDDLESPSKTGQIGMAASESVNLAPALNDSAQRPLNLSGTQFIMPTQADPKVLAELPGDIRSKLVSQARARPQQDSRSASPTPNGPRLPRPRQSAELPPQSQLDPEALAALPEDVRAEVLGYYKQSAPPPPPPPPPTTAATTAPSTRPASSGTLTFKKPPMTPTKRRRGRPSTKSQSTKTLTQSNFVFPRTNHSSTTLTTGLEDSSESRPASPSTTTTTTTTTWNHPSAQSGVPEEVSAEFLAALPEDIRREILDEQRRTRLLQKSGLVARKPLVSRQTTSASAFASGLGSRPGSGSGSGATSSTTEKRLALPPLPERPTFTSKKLSSLSDLRDAVEAWYDTFSTDGPFSEDVASLGKYLRRVVVEEKDLDKAVSVVKWLEWVIDSRAPPSSPRARTRTHSHSPDSPHSEEMGQFPSSTEGNVSWHDALCQVRECVNDAVLERGLPPVEFE